MVYYGLSFHSGNLAGDFYLNFAVFGLVEIPASLLATVNRRFPLIAYYIIGGIALISVFFIQVSGRQDDFSNLFIALALIGKFTFSASNYQMYIHTAELYPTVIRTIGVGFSSMCARVEEMAAPYIVDSAPLFVPPLVFGATSLSARLISEMLPETRGKPLSDFVGSETSEQAKELVQMEDEEDIAGYVSSV